MLTHCPACETRFRVTAEQLKARSGRVRCGRCQTIFNALDNLVEEALAGDAPSPSAPGPAHDVSFAVAPAPTADAARTPQTPAAEDDAHTLVPPAVAHDADGDAPLATRPAGANIDPAHELAAATDADGTASAHPDAAESDAVPATSVATDEPDEPAAPDALPAGTSAATGEPGTALAQPPAADWADAMPEPPPPPRRWPWVLGSLVAFVVLAAQAVLALRTEIAVLWPEGRPALAALCDVAGCEIRRPAKAALVDIEASDLHPDKERPGWLVLTATLKNRAPFAQELPHLELTLTDADDKALARKVLTPADYLPKKFPAGEGMASRADLSLAVGIDPGGLSASGYRLYLFYP